MIFWPFLVVGFRWIAQKYIEKWKKVWYDLGWISMNSVRQNSVFLWLHSIFNRDLTENNQELPSANSTFQISFPKIAFYHYIWKIKIIGILCCDSCFLFLFFLCAFCHVHLVDLLALITSLFYPKSIATHEFELCFECILSKNVCLFFF